MNTAARLAPVFVLASLSACVPLPHFETLAPATHGVLTRDGVPVAGAEIRVAALGVSEVRVASTDAQGRFETEPIRMFHGTAVLLGDSVRAWSMRIVVGGETVEGVNSTRIGGLPSRVRLACELAHPLEHGLGPGNRRDDHCAAVGGDD